MVSYGIPASSSGSSASSRSSSISTLAGIEEVIVEEVTMHFSCLQISSAEDDSVLESAIQVPGSSSPPLSLDETESTEQTAFSSSLKRRRAPDENHYDDHYPAKASKRAHHPPHPEPEDVMFTLNDQDIMSRVSTPEGGFMDDGFPEEGGNTMGVVEENSEPLPEPAPLTRVQKGKQKARMDEQEDGEVASSAVGKKSKESAYIWQQLSDFIQADVTTEGEAGPSSAGGRRRPLLSDDEIEEIARSSPAAPRSRVSRRKLTGKNKQFGRDNVKGGSKMDEKKGDVINSEVLYDCLADYPALPSKSYTGPRDCKNGGFGERSLTMMKERLCLGKLFFVKKKGSAAKGSKPFNHTDLFNQASQGLQNELLWCMGAVGCKNGRSDRRTWNAALRMLVSKSCVLHEAIKAFLAEGSSIMEDVDFLNPAISHDQEMWSQIRRFFWHALDEVCAVAAISIRSSISKGRATRESLEKEVSHTWFRHNAAADRADDGSHLPIVLRDNLEIASFPFWSASLQEEPSSDSEGSPTEDRVVDGYDQYVLDMQMLEWSRAQGLQHWGPGGDMDFQDHVGVNHEDWKWCYVEVENSPFAYEESEGSYGPEAEPEDAGGSVAGGVEGVSGGVEGESVTGEAGESGKPKKNLFEGVWDEMSDS